MNEENITQADVFILISLKIAYSLANFHLGNLIQQNQWFDFKAHYSKVWQFLTDNNLPYICNKSKGSMKYNGNFNF